MAAAHKMDMDMDVNTDMAQWLMGTERQRKRRAVEWPLRYRTLLSKPLELPASVPRAILMSMIEGCTNNISF